MNAIKTSYKYEIGNMRPDGKYNIWTRAYLNITHKDHWDWVIIHVADTRADAVEWIRNKFAAEREENERAA